MSTSSSLPFEDLILYDKQMVYKTCFSEAISSRVIKKKIRPRNRSYMKKRKLKTRTKNDKDVGAEKKMGSEIDSLKKEGMVRRWG